MVPEIVSALGTIREHRGKQALYAATRPDILKGLVEVARIQSTGASNRIENISTSDKRLRELVADKVEPHNRDEREIAGYRFVLDMIHERHDAIPVKPGVILQLHRDLYRFSDTSYAGTWKDADNVIAERTATGEMVARFRPTSAVGTPSAMERLCDEYAEQITKGDYDPLLVSLIFVFDFVSIHPFNDGNGRMSRLLTLLLLYRSGYTVGKYVSIEKEIERTKSTYYEALAASSIGWQDGNNDYVPFVTYMLGVITACYKEARRALRSAILERQQRGSAASLLRRHRWSSHQTRNHGCPSFDEPAHRRTHASKAASRRLYRESRRSASNCISKDRRVALRCRRKDQQHLGQQKSQDRRRSRRVEPCELSKPRSRTHFSVPRLR